ncbi:MAG: hypothetical protein QW717_05375 [Candidatus Bathyarchaeia archaeon]
MNTFRRGYGGRRVKNKASMFAEAFLGGTWLRMLSRPALELNDEEETLTSGKRLAKNLTSPELTAKVS